VWENEISEDLGRSCGDVVEGFSVWCETVNRLGRLVNLIVLLRERGKEEEVFTGMHDDLPKVNEHCDTFPHPKAYLSIHSRCFSSAFRS